MKCTFAHNSINVLDLDKSLSFYKEAFGLEVSAKYVFGGGSIILVFLTDGITPHQLELAWVRDHKEPYNLGENTSHLGFTADDFDSTLTLHKKMDCVCGDYSNNGFYFIKDPDGYLIEIVRKGLIIQGD